MRAATRNVSSKGSVRLAQESLFLSPHVCCVISESGTAKRLGTRAAKYGKARNFTGKAAWKGNLHRSKIIVN
jgi:hypothetical protein